MEEEFEGLTEEEDWVVHGGATDSLSSNTELGKAVREACDELEALASLERESLTKAQQLLQQLGYKGSVLEAPATVPVESPGVKILNALECAEGEQG